MSCSARLPVYALFAGVFFPHSQATVVFSLYVAGIVLALLVTKIMSLTILKAEKSIFVIELLPYACHKQNIMAKHVGERKRICS